MSLDLKLVSHKVRHHVVGSHGFLHSANLCLLIREFNPFRFKVIADKKGLTSVIVLFVFILPY